MTAEHRVDVAVIGAGPCGLGAAWQLERLRAEGATTSYVIVDEATTPGGSASSHVTPEGFTFDIGGHVLYVHDHYPELQALLESLVPAWHDSVPIRGVWIDGRLVPYPVQRNIHRLRTDKMVASLVGLGGVAVRGRIAAGHPNAPAADLESHLRAQFGAGLTRLVLGPLNRKMWAHEPRALGSSWTMQRSGSRTPNVPRTSVRHVLRNLLTQRDSPGWTDATRVRYPLVGGSGAMWTSLARRLPAHRFLLGRRVVSVAAGTKTLELSDGNRVRYDRLITTMPLDAFMRLVRDRPALGAAASELRYSRAHVVGFGVRGAPPAPLRGVHSFHVPQRDVPCWRLSFPAAFSPGNAPPEHWSVLAEASAPSSDRAWDRTSIARSMEATLVRLGMVASTSEIVSRYELAIEHGYPVPFLGRDTTLRRIQHDLTELDIFSRGRFGGWKYEVSNQDHTFMQGVEAIDHIVRGLAETTYAFPDLVN